MHIMPKGKKRKEREAAAAREAEGEEDEAELEEEPQLEIQAGDDDPEDLQVEFAFFDPRPEDYHSMRALLAGGATLPPGIDPGGFADLLSEQAAVGTLVKGDSIDTDVYGFVSAIGLQQHAKVKCVQQLTASVLKRLPDAAAIGALRGWLADAKAPVGLIVSERFVNMPPQLLPNLVDALVQDIDWAVQNADDKAERDGFKFRRLLLLASVQLPKPGGTSKAAAAASPAGKPGKKQAVAAAALPSGAEYCRVEEECLAQQAEAAHLLNGTGRERQMLLVLRLEALRAAVPKLHALIARA